MLASANNHSKNKTIMNDTLNGESLQERDREGDEKKKAVMVTRV